MCYKDSIFTDGILSSKVLLKLWKNPVCTDDTPCAKPLVPNSRVSGRGRVFGPEMYLVRSLVSPKPLGIRHSGTLETTAAERGLRGLLRYNLLVLWSNSILETSQGKKIMKEIWFDMLPCNRYNRAIIYWKQNFWERAVAPPQWDPPQISPRRLFAQIS
jgi:hypothetical protein